MGPSQVDTQASPQQKKGPALSVVKSSNPASVPQADCYCSASRRYGVPGFFILLLY